MLVMTVLQRLVGFGRGIAFCRWLDPEQLGQWDVAFGFINLAAPLAVLGLPGSFGRYFEYYRQRGQVRLFLRRATALCVVSALAAVAVVALGRQWFSVLIFGRAERRVARAVARRLPGRGADLQLSVVHFHGGADVPRGDDHAVLAKRRLRGDQPGVVFWLASHGRQRRGRLRPGLGACASSARIRSSSESGGRAATELPAAVPQRDVLGQAVAVRRLDLDVESAVGPVRHDRSLHDRPFLGARGRRGTAASRLLPHFAAAAAVVRGGLGLVGLDDHAASEPRLGTGPAARSGRAAEHGA